MLAKKSLSITSRRAQLGGKYVFALHISEVNILINDPNYSKAIQQKFPKGISHVDMVRSRDGNPLEKPIDVWIAQQEIQIM